MLKFNNTHIFTGYLKQLLASSNLPRYEIYTNDDELIEGCSYIKDDSIYYCYKEDNKLKLKYIQNYEYHRSKVNETRNLVIKNNIYDTYTHEFLGDYLRFLRDYKHLDLMQMYNCFSNKLCQNLYLNINNNIEFDTANSEYKIYMLPIKLFKNYTVAFETSFPVELCCGFYGEYQYKPKGDTELAYTDEIAKSTYLKLNNSKFSAPILYTKLKDVLESNNEEIKNIIKQNKKDLKLFIKIPNEVKTSIAVLEGNYTIYNDETLRWSGGTTQKVLNYSVINFENTNFDNFRFISPLQLLLMNTGESYPFADKLINYLSGNAITNEDYISNDVKKVQKTIAKRIKSVLPSYAQSFYGDIPGAWDDTIKPVIYNYIIKHKTESRDICDTLGYIDHVAEKYYGYELKRDGEIIEKNTISSIELEDEEK